MAKQVATTTLVEPPAVDEIFIIPGAAPEDLGGGVLKVFDPVLRDFLPPEGRKVENSPYWQRRIRDKDVALAASGGKGGR